MGICLRATSDKTSISLVTKQGLVAKAVELNAQSLCRLANAVGHLQGCCHKLVAGCPAIGCGIRGTYKGIKDQSSTV